MVTVAPRCAARIASAPQPVPISSTRLPAADPGEVEHAVDLAQLRGAQVVAAARTTPTSTSSTRRGTPRTARSTGRSAGGCCSAAPSGVLRSAPGRRASTKRRSTCSGAGTSVAIRAANGVSTPAGSGLVQSPAMYASPKPMFACAPSRWKNAAGRTTRSSGPPRPIRVTVRKGHASPGRLRAAYRNSRSATHARAGEYCGGAAGSAHVSMESGHWTPFCGTWGGRGTTGSRRSHSATPCRWIRNRTRCGSRESAYRSTRGRGRGADAATGDASR